MPELMKCCHAAACKNSVAQRSAAGLRLPVMSVLSINDACSETTASKLAGNHCRPEKVHMMQIVHLVLQIRLRRLLFEVAQINRRQRRTWGSG